MQHLFCEDPTVKQEKERKEFWTVMTNISQPSPTPRALSYSEVLVLCSQTLMGQMLMQQLHPTGPQEYLASTKTVRPVSYSSM